MRILVADDDPSILQLLELRIRGWGYQVVTATNGTDAWRHLSLGDPPPIAILDWGMPGISGLELCSRLRERVGAPYIYTLLLTGRDDKTDVVAGMDAGADDYLTKPVHEEELRARLDAGKRIVLLENSLRRSIEEVRQAEEAALLARQRENEVARRIQSTLLTGSSDSAPARANLAALSCPSREVDGDFWEWVPFRDDLFDLMIGDAMGKGVPAALLGAAIKEAFLRSLVTQIAERGGEPPDPVEIVNAVHERFTGQVMGLDSFVTLCYARFDLRQGLLKLVNCGHTGTVKLGLGAGPVSILHHSEMPLGFSEKETYSQLTLPLAPSDTFIFYSDALTEMQNEEGELFGEARLIAAVESLSDRSPDGIITRLREVTEQFRGAAMPRDDLTCVVVQVLETGLAFSEERSLEGDLSELPVIREFVARCCAMLPHVRLSDEWVSELQLAVCEAMANIVEHAYGGKPGQGITVQVDGYPTWITVRLDYGGTAFDPSSVRTPAFDGAEDGGFGLYLITQTVDEAHYSTDSRGQNHIGLVKKFEGAA